MLKPVLNGSTFCGSFLAIFAILGVLTLNLAFLTPNGTSLSEKTSTGVFHETLR